MLFICEVLWIAFALLVAFAMEKVTANSGVITDESTAAENDPTDVERVKVEVVKRPTVRKIPSQL